MSTVAAPLTLSDLRAGMLVEYVIGDVTYFGRLRAPRSPRTRHIEAAWGEPALDLELWLSPTRRGDAVAKFVRLSRFTLDADGVLRGNFV